MKTDSVAVAGATGAVGRQMLSVLEKTGFPVSRLHLLASVRSAGKKIKYNGVDIEIAELSKNWIQNNKVDIVLMSAGGGVSKLFSPLFAEREMYVIDNSSAWRMDPDVPLVVPEINPETLAKGKYIIANPNCSTIQLVHALRPIHELSRIKRIVVSTYQAVSGAGQSAIEELKNQTALISGKGFSDFTVPRKNFSAFPHQIAFNCIPQIDVFLEDGSTKEETKMVNETKKYFQMISGSPPPVSGYP